MTRFVVIGRTATAAGDFRLDDLASTSGRLDVLLRCVRAALLRSHGLRRDVVVYLVLRGGPAAPRVVRVEGARAKFLRPDERSLATLMKKVLALDPGGAAFVEVKPGIAVARADLDEVLEDLGGAALFMLEEHAPDIREVREIRSPGESVIDAGGVLGVEGRAEGASVRSGAAPDDAAFFVGDHLGFDETTRARLLARGARPISVGPVSLHSDDVVAIVSNEVDRARAALR